MKRFLTAAVCVAIAILSVLPFAACGEGKKDSVINVRPATITVGYTDAEPMNYTKDGVLVGFDTELTLRIFNALGYEVRFKLIEWSNKYVEINGGTIDVIWNGFTANSSDNGKARSELVDFSYYYMENGQCIIKKKTTASVASVEDLAGKSLAYETNSAADALIEEELKNVSVNKKNLAAQMDAVIQVKNGTADYAMIDIILAKSLLKQADYSELDVNEGLELGTEYYAIGFKKGSPLTAKVNDMLEAYAKIGYLNVLAEKYGLSDVVITEFDK